MHKQCFRAIEAKHRTLKEIGVYPHPFIGGKSRPPTPPVLFQVVFELCSSTPIRRIC
jgi:hypothetical protein